MTPVIEARALRKAFEVSVSTGGLRRHTRVVRAFVAALGATGDTTIVLTTHDLADTERRCRRLVVIDQGRVVHDGSLEDLHARYGSRRRSRCPAS